MPFHFNTNLLEYYENNVPASSQTAPIPAATYPPIGPPGAISSTNAFSDQYATGFQTGFTPGVPSNIVGLDAIGQIFTCGVGSHIKNLNNYLNQQLRIEVKNISDFKFPKGNFKKSINAFPISDAP